MLFKFVCQIQAADPRQTGIVVHLVSVQYLSAVNIISFQNSHRQPGSLAVDRRRHARWTGTDNQYIINLFHGISSCSIIL